MVHLSQVVEAHCNSRNDTVLLVRILELGNGLQDFLQNTGCKRER